MKIKEFLEKGDKKKVHFFLNAVEEYVKVNKKSLMTILKDKPVGKMRHVFTNGKFTFKIIGTFSYSGPEFFCEDCKIKHRQIVVNIENVSDMTGSIIENVN